MILTCLESLRCITQALKDNYAEDVREAVRVLNQFPEAFENIDKKLQDPVLTDICRRLPELHFGKSKALIETPAKTIWDAYFERTGKMLPETFCTAAYHTIRICDIDRGKIPAENSNTNTGMNCRMNSSINSGMNGNTNNSTNTGMNGNTNNSTNTGMNGNTNNSTNTGMNTCGGN